MLETVFRLPTINAWWSTVCDLGKDGRLSEPQSSFVTLERDVLLFPRQVTAIRAVTQEDRDTPLGAVEDDGTPRVHPTAKTVVEARTKIENTRFFTADVLDELFFPGQRTVEDVRALNPTSKLALAVIAAGHAEAVERPAMEGGVIKDVSGPVRRWLLEMSDLMADTAHL